MSRTAVLAYSGGLDTSCAIAWLKEDYGFDEVVAVLVDVGQQAEFESAIARGRAAGADDVLLVDRKDAFAEDQVAKTLVANATNPGPGEMLTVSPSFTYATRTATTMTSSIPHRPSSSTR